jgi:hypothetical protein
MGRLLKMTAKPESRDGHILPHRAWNSVKFEGAFSLEEHAHIVKCAQCLRLFGICLEADTFGSVLKQLNEPAA